jgi:acetolactate synthase-1/2/3 large subunit
MAIMTGAQALVEMLHRHGINTLFGLPGYQNDSLYNALFDAQHADTTASAIRVIHTRHEQGAAYMAYGYAKSTGHVGAFAVVPGPGMLNTTAALATAFAASVPVLCITGQIPTSAIGRGTGQLHEIPNSQAVLRSLTKWSERVDRAADLPALVDEAFKQLRTGRPRPVALEVPMDVLATPADIHLTHPPTNYAQPAPNPTTIAQAAQLLALAKNPMIVVGSGANEAGDELRTLAERLQAPVVHTTNGHGILSDHHYLSLPGPGGHALWAQADVVLAVGTRFQQPARWGVDSNLKLIRVEIDPDEIHRAAPATLNLIADAKLTLAALNAALADTPQRPSRQQQMGALKEELDEAFSQIQPQHHYVNAIRNALPDNGIFVEDLTQVGYASRYMLPIYHSRSQINSNYQGTLGYGFGAALGAKVAHPDWAVLCVTGDGGFMYNVQELATAVQHNIGLVTVIFNDGAFGNVKRMQVQNYGGRVIATELRNPDFVALAQAYGAIGLRVHSPAELASTLEVAFKQNEPTLIEVPVGEMSSPWEYIMMSQVRGGLSTGMTGV